MLFLDFSKLFSTEYWFAGYPGLMSRPFLLGVVGVLVVSCIGIVYLRVLQVRFHTDAVKRRLFRRSANILTAGAVLFSIITFFRQEEIYILGARFWVIVLGIGMIIAAANLVRSLERLRREYERVERDEQKRKYLTPTKR